MDIGLNHHYPNMPSILGFVPRLLLGMRTKAHGNTQTTPYSVSAPLPWAPQRLEQFRAAISDPQKAIPPTYPAAVLTPLFVAVVADKRFPFPPIGLIHRSEEIHLLAPIPEGEPLQLRTELGEATPCPAGAMFALHSEASVDGRLIWRCRSEIVWKDPKNKRKTSSAEPPEPLSEQTQVTVDLSLARAYAAASGNRDPIHTSPFLARRFGLPGVIIHGLWTMARVNALLPECPPPFRLYARFRKPVVVPKTLDLSWSPTSVECPFQVQDAQTGALLVSGTRQALSQ